MGRLLLLVSAIIFVDALLFTALTPLVPMYAEEFPAGGAGLSSHGAGRSRGIPVASLPPDSPKRAVIAGLLLLSVRALPSPRPPARAALGGACSSGIASTATGRNTRVISITPRHAPRREIGTAFGADLRCSAGPAFGERPLTSLASASVHDCRSETLGFAALASLTTGEPRERITHRAPAHSVTVDSSGVCG
jgi:hypothetical protein